MPATTGWQHYGSEIDQTVRTSLLSSLMGFVAGIYQGQEKPTGLETFKKDIRWAVTPTQLEQLYNVIWQFTARYHNSPARTYVLAYIPRLCEKCAKLDYDNAVAEIRRFDPQSLLPA